GLVWPESPPFLVGDGRFGEAPKHSGGAGVAELPAAPGLPDGEDVPTSARAHRQLAGRIVRSLQPWTNAGSLELRYVWGAPPGRLRVLVVARAAGRSMDSARQWATHMLQAVADQFPPGYEFGPLTDALPTDITAWAEVQRVEEVRAPGPFVPPGLADYYYLVHPLAGDGSAWPTLPAVLSRASSPGFLSIALVPTVLTDLERQAVDHVVTLTRHLAEPQQGYDFFGNATSTPADGAARDVLAVWQRFTGSQGFLARIGVASTADDVRRIASQVGAVLTESTDAAAGDLPARFALVTDVDHFEAWQTTTMGLVFPRGRHEVWSLPPQQAPVPLERMPHFFSEEEAGGLLVLPVPDRSGVPGLVRSRRASTHRATVPHGAAGDDGVNLGSAVHLGSPGGTVTLPLRAINRHALVVGAPGSGKTSTVLHLLLQLWRDHRIPFLVIESVLTEYRSLLDHPDMRGLRVLTLGNESIAPLRLNPLAPPPGVRCEVHMGAVMAALKLALPLPPPIPQILAQALTRTYTAAGWDDDSVLEDGLTPPTLRDLLRTFTEVFDGIGYQGEARNIGLAFQVRLQSLLQGGRGKMLDTVSSVDFDELLSGPVVVELNDIADADERAVLSAFVLERVRASAKARGSSGGRLRHVTVLEEAHRLLGRAGQHSGDAASGDQARADSVRAFCEAIAELRSLGEGFVLSTQSPSALAEVAVANTGTRILHRMESSADRNTMLDDLDADETLRRAAASLAVGEAVVRWPALDEPELVQVRPDPSLDSGRRVDDRAVREAMSAHRAEVARLLPYQLCSSAVCTSGCQATTRRTAGQTADLLGADVGARWRRTAEAGLSALPELAASLARHSAGDVALAYCTAVHLSSRGHGFPHVPGADHRPLLARAIRDAVRPVD
ncbi:ATP-binding protein, partial [Blastococcus sp. SYSU D00813]